MPTTVWARQEGEMPGAPIYAREDIARHLTARDYAEALDLDDDEVSSLCWEPEGNLIELYAGDEPTGWFIHQQTVIQEVD